MPARSAAHQEADSDVWSAKCQETSVSALMRPYRPFVQSLAAKQMEEVGRAIRSRLPEYHQES